MARYADLESMDSIDTVESEENLLVSRTSTLAEAEYTSLTTETDLYPSSEEGSNLEISDTDSLAGGLYEVEGELEGFGSMIATLNDNTYGSPTLIEENPNTETRYGTAGNDYIEGRTWIRDTIYGLAGDDFLWGGDELGPGDTILGGDGNDTIYGGFGEDELHGDAGDDVIDGGESSDVIYGGDGNDQLFGGAGNDKMFGMAGNDTLHGGDGNDYLDVGYHGYYGDSGVAFGDAGDDYLSGSRGVDHLYGGEGNDRIYGADNIDYLDGGSGNDVIWGGNGHDMIWGGAGNDEVRGGNGYDLIFGGAGDDVLHGDGTNEPVDDMVNGDSVYGEDGNDRIYGSDRADYLYGGAGHDIVQGGDGDDVIDGGTGSDSMTGGAGRDTFVLADRPYQGGYHYNDELDVITDFQFYTGNTSFTGDWIDMRQLFDKHTNFTGTTANEAWAQGYLYLAQHGNPGDADFGTKVYIDPNGHAPDQPGYYGQSHDFVAVDLLGVAQSEFDAFNQEAAFLSKYFLV